MIKIKQLWQLSQKLSLHRVLGVCLLAGLMLPVVVFSPNVSAQISPRIIPKDSKIGMLSVSKTDDQDLILIRGDAYPVSVRLRVYDQRYRIVRLSQLSDQRFYARYWFNARQEVETIWLLDDKEVPLPSDGDGNIRIKPY